MFFGLSGSNLWGGTKRIPGLWDSANTLATLSEFVKGDEFYKFPLFCFLVSLKGLCRCIWRSLELQSLILGPVLSFNFLMKGIAFNLLVIAWDSFGFSTPKCSGLKTLMRLDFLADDSVLHEFVFFISTKELRKCYLAGESNSAFTNVFLSIPFANRWFLNCLTSKLLTGLHRYSTISWWRL